MALRLARAGFDDALHDQRRAEPQDAGQRCEVLVIELPVGGQVAGDDTQEVVRIAEQALSLEHVRNRGELLLEGGDGLTVLVAHGDEDQRLETQTEDAGVEPGVVAGDRSGAFQSAQAAVAGRDAEAA